MYTYLIGRAAEPGVPGGAAVPEGVLHAENGDVLRQLRRVLAAAAVIFGIVEGGDNGFLCLLLGQHCFFDSHFQKGFRQIWKNTRRIKQKRSMRQRKIHPLLPRKRKPRKEEKKNYKNPDPKQEKRYKIGTPQQREKNSTKKKTKTLL